MPATSTIGIVLNGDSYALPSGSSVLDLIVSLGLDPSRVAVELDRAILRRSEWDTTTLGDRAQVEIVQFVGGG